MESGDKKFRFPAWLRTVVIGRRPKWTVVRIVVLVLIVWAVRSWAILPIRVHGPSMLPTYSQDGVNFVNRLAYRRTPPQRGDVVAIRLAGISIMYMKRIVGLPGETIAFEHGRLMVNGVVLQEPYLKYFCDWTREPVTLAPDEYFVVGDNRSMPQEYHYFGKTKQDHIVGRIVLCKNLFGSPPEQF